jgi:WSC domain
MHPCSEKRPAGDGFTLKDLETDFARECYCANLLNGLSNKLPDSSCNLPCAGNSSQICGGDLALTVYQQQTSTKGAGIKGVREAPVSSILALGIAIAVLLCLA